MGYRLIGAAVSQLACELLEEASLWPEEGIKKFLHFVIRSRHVEGRVALMPCLEPGAHELANRAPSLDVSLKACRITRWAETRHKHSALVTWTRGWQCHRYTAGCRTSPQQRTPCRVELVPRPAEPSPVKVRWGLTAWVPRRLDRFSEVGARLVQGRRETVDRRARRGLPCEKRGASSSSRRRKRMMGARHRGVGKWQLSSAGRPHLAPSLAHSSEFRSQRLYGTRLQLGRLPVLAAKLRVLVPKSSNLVREEGDPLEGVEEEGP